MADDPTVSLNRLSRSVPEPIVDLVADPDLRTLLASFPDGSARGHMLKRLRRLPLNSSGDLDEPPSDGTRQGLRVLWIDDHPEYNRREVDILQRDGVSVSVAEDLHGARDVWRRSGPFDAIISDVARVDVADAGFVDLAALRQEFDWHGPAVFYTSRITREGRERAAELGAGITTSFEGILTELSRATAA